MDFSYDEDLSSNNFFKELQNEQENIIEEAIISHWKICVPCKDSLNHTIFTDIDYLAHILVPEPELPGTHYISLSGNSITIQNRVLTVESDGIPPHQVHLLFQETFYTDKGSYQVWCIEAPLRATNLHEGIIFNKKYSLNTISDCIRFLWTETGSKETIENIDTHIKNNHVGDKLKKCSSLNEARDLIATVYSECLAVTLSNRSLRSKSKQSPSFSMNIRLIVETYILHFTYRELFETIGAFCASEDSSFNKILRNLSDLQLRDFDVKPEFSGSIPAAKKMLSSIQNSYSVLEKVGRLKKTLTLITPSNAEKIDSSTPFYLSTDDSLPVLIFLVVKSGMSNWISQVNFLKHFRVSGNGSDCADEFSYYISTLEAVIEHITSRSSSASYLPESQMNYDSEFDNNFVHLTPTSSRRCSETESKRDLRFDGEPGTVNYLFHQIKIANFDEVKTILESNSNVLHTVFEETEKSYESRKSISIEDVLNDDDFDSSSKLCHPLCDCSKCCRLLSRKAMMTSPTIRSRNEHGFTALHVACIYGEPHIVDFLIEMGADVNSVDSNGSTPLHYASSKGHQNAQLLLLNAGIDINRQNMEKNSALHLACNNGHSNCVKALIYFAEHCQLKIDIDVENDFGETPLHLASKWGYDSIARLLLECGANPWLKNTKGKTPIDVSQSIVMLKLLTSILPTLNDYDNISIDFPSCEEYDDLTSDHEISLTESKLDSEVDSSLSIETIRQIERLFCAISYGDTKLACFYLNIDLNMKKSDLCKKASVSDLCHPLCTCSSCLQRSNIYSGASPSQLQLCDSQGNTALHVAAKHGRLDMCGILIEHGALLEVVNKLGYTPSHMAVKHSKLAVMELFAKENININLKDNLGNTLLHLASESDNIEMVELLLKLNPLLLNNAAGKTALNIAQDRMHLTIFTMIEEATQ